MISILNTISVIINFLTFRIFWIVYLTWLCPCNTCCEYKQIKYKHFLQKSLWKFCFKNIQKRFSNNGNFGWWFGYFIWQTGGVSVWRWWRMSNHSRILFLWRWREEKNSAIVKGLVKGQVQHLFEIYFKKTMRYCYTWLYVFTFAFYRNRYWNNKRKNNMLVLKWFTRIYMDIPSFQLLIKGFNL